MMNRIRMIWNAVKFPWSMATIANRWKRERTEMHCIIFTLIIGVYEIIFSEITIGSGCFARHISPGIPNRDVCVYPQIQHTDESAEWHRNHPHYLGVCQG